MSRFLRLAFWAALVFAFTMAVLPKPPRLPSDPSDKVQHILAFLTLTALVVAAYPRMSLLNSGLALSAFGILIELVQLIPALNRDSELVDWIADTAAVIVVLLVVKVWRRFTAQPSPRS